MDDERTIEQLKRRIDALERSASLGLLLSAIVHEVNNPMSVILIGADTLQRQSEDSGAVDRHLAMLEQQCEKIMALNQRLVEYSRRNLGKARTVDARDLVGEFVDLEAWIEGAACAPRVRVPDEPLDVSVDPELTLQVIRYLARAVRAGRDDAVVDLSLGRETVPLIELPNRCASPTRDFAVFRLVVGSPAEAPVPITDWLGRFFDRPAERRALELMACWEIVRKLGGRMRMGEDAGGAEIQLMLPVDQPKGGRSL